MDGATTGAIIGAATATFAVIFLMLSRKPVNCEKCGREQPKVRTPANMQQVMWGGYTCQGCGSELTARGKLRPATKG